MKKVFLFLLALGTTSVEVQAMKGRETNGGRGNISSMENKRNSRSLEEKRQKEERREEKQGKNSAKVSQKPGSKKKSRSKKKSDDSERERSRSEDKEPVSIRRNLEPMAKKSGSLRQENRSKNDHLNPGSEGESSRSKDKEPSSLKADFSSMNKNSGLLRTKKSEPGKPSLKHQKKYKREISSSDASEGLGDLNPSMIRKPQAVRTFQHKAVQTNFQDKEESLIEHNRPHILPAEQSSDPRIEKFKSKYSLIPNNHHDFSNKDITSDELHEVVPKYKGVKALLDDFVWKYWISLDLRGTKIDGARVTLKGLVDLWNLWEETFPIHLGKIDLVDRKYHSVMLDPEIDEKQWYKYESLFWRVLDLQAINLSQKNLTHSNLNNIFSLMKRQDNFVSAALNGGSGGNWEYISYMVIQEYNTELSLSLRGAKVDGQDISISHLLSYCKKLPQTLKKIDLGDCVAIPNINDEVHDYKEDNFWTNEQKIEAVIGLLQRMPHLKELVVQTELSEEIFTAFSLLNNLKVLTLQTDMNYDQLKHLLVLLKDCGLCQTLDLKDTTLYSKKLSTYRLFDQTESLRFKLDHNGLPDALNKIHLEEWAIFDSENKDISAFLKKMPYLKELVLKTEFSDEVFRALLGLKNLKTLAIQSDMTYDQLKNVVRMLQEFTNIPGSIETLNLNQATLHNKKFSIQDLFPHIDNLPSNVKDVDIGDVITVTPMSAFQKRFFIETLSRMPRVRELLGVGELKNDLPTIFEGVQTYENIQSLNLREAFDCHPISLTMLPQRAHSLQTLDLGDSVVTSLSRSQWTNFFTLFPHIERLKELIITENLDNPGLKLALKAIQKRNIAQTPLESLDLSKATLNNLPFSLEGLLAHLKDLPENLTRLNIGNAVTVSSITKENQDSYWKLLSYMPHLQTLSLKDNAIGDMGLVALIPLIKNMSRLEVWDLGGNALTDLCFVTLTHIFDNIPNLQTLKLAENKISDEGIKFLGNALHLVPNLEMLDLGENTLSSKGVRALIATLKAHTPHFKILNMKGNPINPEEQEEIRKSFGGVNIQF